MHGLGNDFVILDCRAGRPLPSLAQRQTLAHRKRGIGCDQLIILVPPQSPAADIMMLIYNPDGSEAGACGNATRCVAKLLFEERSSSKGIIETIAGLLPVWQEADSLISVDFGPPRLEWQEIPLAEAMETLTLPVSIGGLSNPCAVNMGNPHAVFFMPEVMAVPLAELGPQLEHHPLFPERANIEVAQILSPTHIRMRVWERSAGITEACGSGACATLVAAVRRGLTERKATITLDGGDLAIEWREDGHVIMTGSATASFSGLIDAALYQI
jgi:diaminopimelate epimerase